MQMRNAVIRTVAVGTTAIRVAQPSKARVRLEFHPLATGSYVVHTSSDLSVSDGIPVTAAGAVVITVEAHGLLLKQAWFAIAATTVAVPIVEVVE